MARPQIPRTPHEGWAIPSRYQMQTIIGSGSYGSVCQAFDKEQDCAVAIKRVKHMFDDLIDCKRILRELAILTCLNHRNVVQIMDIVCPTPVSVFDELYIVMEICDSDLKKLIKQDVHLTPEHIHTLLYSLLVGLKYLHSAGIYHRDLKPANCLCNQDCTVKICDFGLSRAIGDQQLHLHELPNTPRENEAEEGQTHVRVVHATARAKRAMTQHVVTRWYRAPELILLQDNYTEAIDMWSVGCIYAELLQMLEGNYQDRSPLFPGSSCFPLSPNRHHKNDFKFHTRGSQDQLNMIFDLLGTPTEDDLGQLEREDAKRYLKHFKTREASGIASRFPNVDALSIDLLEQMLKFSPALRCQVQQALEHDLLVDYRAPETETDRKSVV